MAEKEPDFFFAESFTSDFAFSLPGGSGQENAGSYSVWVDDLWTYDAATNTRGTTEIGTSIGRCMFMTSAGTDGYSHCEYTLTLVAASGEESKLMVMGSVKDLDWVSPGYELAVVGGTGDFLGASGKMVVARLDTGGFNFLNSIYLV